MVSCERCGSRFSPVQAATIGYCPRCLLRDDVSVPLIVSVFKAPRGEEQTAEPGPKS